MTKRNFKKNKINQIKSKGKNNKIENYGWLKFLRRSLSSLSSAVTSFKPLSSIGKSIITKSLNIGVKKIKEPNIDIFRKKHCRTQRSRTFSRK